MTRHILKYDVKLKFYFFRGQFNRHDPVMGTMPVILL